MGPQEIGYIVAVLLMLAGLAGVFLPLLPGTPLLFAGMTLAAWTGDFQRVGGIMLGTLGALMLVSIVLDYVAGALGAKRVNASAQAVWGSVLGTIAGLFFGLPGLILGPFVGAAAGEYLARKDAWRAGHVGLATWLGLLIGAVAKIAISLMMVGLFVFAWFW
ncbi:DUF456 domain-containing protein [Chitinibacteraceae bacterium HSL-7]